MSDSNEQPRPIYVRVESLGGESNEMHEYLGDIQFSTLPKEYLEGINVYHTNNTMTSLGSEVIMGNNIITQKDIKETTNNMSRLFMHDIQLMSLVVDLRRLEEDINDNIDRMFKEVLN